MNVYCNSLFTWALLMLSSLTTEWDLGIAIQSKSIMFQVEITRDIEFLGLGCAYVVKRDLIQYFLVGFCPMLSTDRGIHSMFLS